MNLPSKELINAVMLFVPNVMELSKDGKSLDIYELSYEDSSVIEGGNVNIYELMHMMKKWAVNKGFVVLSRNDSIGYRWTVILSIPSNLNFNKPFEQLSEFEAVTKACEWILNERV